LALQIHEELEAAATVRANSSNSPSSAQALHPGEAWIQLIEQRQAMATLTLSLYEQLMEQQQRYLGAQNQLALEARQAQSTQTQLEEARQHLKQAEEEGELVLAQLHQVQEELEKVFLNKQEQTQQFEALKKELKATKAPVLAPPPDNTKVKDLEEENDLLLAQLHQVQEELERYYLENQDLKNKQPKPQPKPTGAALRIQQQLSYRLGAALIKHGKTPWGWLRMPFALAGQVRAYSADQRAKAGQKLPPIHSYADAHEADRYRQHLSYQLGQTLLKHGKTPWGWLWLPFALAGTARAFKKARAS
jgi:chromosome segregation ATPase